jgi:zinc/manganese transport system permease protein
MMLYDYLFQPFVEYGFMRRALVACIALSLSGAPLGVFLTLRRMTLVGDAMSHAILPGASIAFVITGVALWPMTLGGLAAGLIVALVAGAVTRLTQLKEDASFTAAYLISLALGVFLISMRGSTIDLMHVLFGNVLAVADASLVMVISIASVSLVSFAIIYRHLIVECFDPNFFRAAKGRGALVHQLFLALVVLNLVAAFQALGTLMAMGLMVLPAIAAKFWTDTIDRTIGLSVVFAVLSAFIGLLLSYHFSVPSGPAIVLTAGALYVVSVLLGSNASLGGYLFRHKHFAE